MSLPVLADSLGTYLAEVARFPVLSAEEERRLAERYYKERRVEDAHRLTVSNLRYVVKIALEYRNYGARLQDLVQEGNIGLMVAVKKFDPYKGFRLITYATWWIKAFMQDFILRTRGLVRRSSKALKKKLFYREKSLALKGYEDLSEDLSLDAAIGDGDKTTHLDMLPDTSPGAFEAVAGSRSTALVKREVKAALSALNEKERMVIEKRVMADEPESLQGLGDKMGLTRERVRQIEGEALKKLRKALSEKKEALELLPG